jgi:F0F1-type ATP synthase membrane subunit b/b'
MLSDENPPPSASAYDDHEARIAKQEKAVVDLQYELALFRQQTDSNFEALRLQIENAIEKARDQLRNEFPAALHAAEQRLTTRVIEETRRVESKLDSMVRWMIGLQLTTTGLVAALIGYGYLN